MYAKAIPLFIFALINLLFAIIIFRRRRGKNYAVYYSFVVFFLAVWAFFHAMFHLNMPPEESRFSVNFIYFSGSMIATLFLMFTIIFHKTRKLSLAEITSLSGPTIVIGYFLFFTNKIITVVASGQEIIFGMLYLVFVIHFFLYMLLAFYNLFRTRKQSDGTSRLQVSYVIYGTGATAVIASITNILLPTVGVFNLQFLGPVSSVIMISLFAYAMRRHECAWGYLIQWNKASGFL